MKPKNLLILTAVLVFLLGALFIKKAFMKPEVETSEYKSLEISVAPSDIYAIEAVKPPDEELLRIEKTDEGTWTIPSKNNIKADKTKIEGLIGALAGLKGELRSRSRGLFGDYGISDDEAFIIRLIGRDGGAMKTLYFGTQRPEYGEAFLRVDGSQEVYLVNKDIYPQFGIYGDPEEVELNAGKWVDLSLLGVDVDAVEALRIDKPGSDEGTAVHIEREFDEQKQLRKWNAPANEPEHGLDADKIKSYLNEINIVKGMKAVDPGEGDYGFEEPYMVFSLEISDEKPVDLVIGAEETEGSGNRYVKNRDGHVFLVRKYVISKLDAGMEKFAAEPPAEPEPEAEPETATEEPPSEEPAG